MKLITFKRKEDFGVEFYVQIINVKKWSLLQLSVSWNDYPSWPYLQVTFGSNGLFSILFWVYKFGLDVDILSRTWNWNYLEKDDEDGFQVDTSLDDVWPDGKPKE